MTATKKASATRMRIGEFARRAGVTPQTIRFYERLGLLRPTERQGTGHRYYSDVELGRLHKVNALKGIGLPLEQIRSVMPLYFKDPTGLLGKQKVMKILLAQHHETEARIESLVRFRSELRSNIRKLQGLMQQARKGQRRT